MQEVSLEMGPLKFVSSSHNNQNARNLKISDESEIEINEMIEKECFNIVEEPFELGEVSFHAGIRNFFNINQNNFYIK